MTSRKQRERRAERIAAEEAAAEEARRRRMVQLLSLGVLAALVVVAVLIVVSQSGDDGGGDATIEDAADVDRLLRGLDQDGIKLGDPNAKLTVTEYGDLQCPVCKQFSETVVSDLISGPVREGEAKLEFRNWTIIGPDSKDAARAALAASEQGRYWSFIELFYRNQGTENSGYVTDAFLTAVAEGAGVPDLDGWEEDRQSSGYDDAIAKDGAAADRLGFTGTPSFTVSGPGGTQAIGTPSSAAEISKALASVR